MTQSQYTYYVDGNEFTDTEAFGKAWQEAKELATQLHCGIFRKVVKVEIREEWYGNGIFLDMKHYDGKEKKF